MNWEAIGAVGEIVGAVAVVGSLLYLATQIRTQTRDSKLAAVRELTANLMESYAPLLDPQLAEVWTRGAKDFDKLADSEKAQMIAFLQIYFRALESAYYQANESGLDSRIWDGIIRHTGSLLATSAVERIWQARKRSYSEEFQAFVDNIKIEDYTVG